LKPAGKLFFGVLQSIICRKIRAVIESGFWASHLTISMPNLSVLFAFGLSFHIN